MKFLHRFYIYSHHRQYMTSQLALMNSMAVALASDSAVTIGSKTYNGVKKIFKLKNSPKIGIMISNIANYIPCNISWERVIRLFDESNSDSEFNTVSDCVEAFKKFVSSEKILSPNSENSISLQHDLINFVEEMIDIGQKRRFEEATRDLSEEIYSKFEGLDTHLEEAFGRRIEIFFDVILEFIDEQSDDEKFEHKRISKIHTETVKQASEIFCEKHQLGKSLASKIKTIMSYHLCSVPALKKQYNWRDYTNLVIAGFGSKHITPELHELKVGAIVDEKIGPFYEADIHKIRIPQNLMDNGGLDSEGNLYSASAFIIPYAQKEEIQNILNGIHPEFERRYLQTQIPTNLLDTVKNSFISCIESTPGIGPATKEKILSSLDSNSENILDEIKQEIHAGGRHWAGKTRRQRFRDSTKIMDPIQLAKFAEKIVNIEAEVAYYSNQRTRSVGGEILVAYISMEDGLQFV